MATLKNTTINDTGYLQLPVGTQAQRPAGQNGMMRYNTDLNGLEYWAEDHWIELPLPYYFRTIITTAYMMGGYRGGTAWNNCNRVVAATDTTTNLGDGSIERSFNYQSSCCNKDVTFVMGAGNGHSVPSNYVIAFNMRTESQLTSGFTRTVANNNYNTGTLFKGEEFAWNAGGGSNIIEEMNLTTQTIYTTGGTMGISGACWGMSAELYGNWFDGGTCASYYFATRTAVNRGGTQPSANHQQKSVQSKLNFNYAGNEGSYAGGYNLRRTSNAINVTYGTVVKPIGNSGEENFTLGQDHQYMLGMFNGNQNNASWRFNYATESGFQGSSTMEPKGKAGASSGACGWRD